MGALTDRDIVLAALRSGKPLSGIRVEEAMTRPVVTIGEHERINHVESLMCRDQIRRLVVVDDGGRAVGVVSLGDLAREAGREVERTGIGREAVAATLAAISSPAPGPSRPPEGAEAPHHPPGL